MKTDNNYPWINPIGGLGDTLMLSGVLKLLIETNPDQKFNLVRRVSYSLILKDHPAIAMTGHPPKDAVLLKTDYWNHEKLGTDQQRAFQILCRMFGVATPAQEELYLPLNNSEKEDALFNEIIPYGKTNILISQSSSSPRKEMHPAIWHKLVDMLLNDGHFVAQVGRMRDIHVKNAYSLLGLTTPRQLISLLNRFDMVITADNFIMHAAHLVGKPAIVLWGPTDHRVYGYAGQIHLQAEKRCDSACLGPETGHLYDTPCPMNQDHCIDSILPEEIYTEVKNHFSNKLKTSINTALSYTEQTPNN